MRRGNGENSAMGPCAVHKAGSSAFAMAREEATDYRKKKWRMEILATEISLGAKGMGDISQKSYVTHTKSGDGRETN